MCRLSGGTVSFAQTVAAGADGRFKAVFPAVCDTRSAYLLTAESGEERIAAHVRFGDVYLTLGQSNMTYSLSAAEDCEMWLERAAAAEISLLDLADGTGRIVRPPFPENDLKEGVSWTAGTDAAVKDISALSVQVCARLSEKNGIPVGAVHASVGGLSVEACISRATAEADGAFVAFLKKAGRYRSLEEYNRGDARDYTQISGVWNEKIAPLKGLSFAGVVWYLGESSAFDSEYADGYLRGVRLLLKDVRRLFKDIPFIAVQIAPQYYPYGDKYGYLYVNEAIARVETEDENVVAIPVYDIEPRWLKPDGETYYHPIHTVNKTPVSERIAAALQNKKRYPRIVSVEFLPEKAVCRVEGGAPLAAGEYFGFTLAGENGKYYPARARAIGEREIEAVSPDVENPRFLTYAFMQYQDFCNVRAADGAPLLPFRSASGSVGENYCFPPAYTADGALEVYENCFGWQTGTCHKVPVWRSGEIYRAGEVALSVRKTREGMFIAAAAVPRAEDFYLFGVSSVLCLSGHKSHIADFDFLNFEMKAEGAAEFVGVVVRAADGETYRFDTMNGGQKEYGALPVTDKTARYCISLKTGVRGDFAPVIFPSELRKKFVQAEFVFRARREAVVLFKGFTLSDRNFSASCNASVKEAADRADTKLPASFDE